MNDEMRYETDLYIFHPPAITASARLAAQLCVISFVGLDSEKCTALATSVF